jgi:hypothetical protein
MVSDLQGIAGKSFQEPGRTSEIGYTFWRCHRSLENQPRKVELNQPMTLHRRNERFHSKKLHGKVLQGGFWNENAKLQNLPGWFNSTLAGRFAVTADTGEWACEHSVCWMTAVEPNSHLVTQPLLVWPHPSSNADAFCARHAPFPHVPARTSSIDFLIWYAIVAGSWSYWPSGRQSRNRTAGDNGSEDQGKTIVYNWNICGDDASASLPTISPKAIL